MEKFVESDIEKLKKQISEKKQGKIIGNINNVEYEINLNKPVRAVFKSEENEIEIYSGKLASSRIEVYREEKRVHYRKKNSLNVGVSLIHVINVIKSEINNKEYISEKYFIREQFDDNMIPKKSSKIIEDLLSNDNKLKSTSDGEFVIEPIKNNDELKSIIHSEEDLNKYLIEGSKTKLGDFPSGFYEDSHDFEFNKKSKTIQSKNTKELLSKASSEILLYKELYNKILNIEKEKEDVTPEEKEAVEEIQDEVLDNNEEQQNDEKDITEIDLVAFVNRLKEENKIDNKEEIEVEEQEEVSDNTEEEQNDERDITETDLNNLVNQYAEKRREEERKKIREAKVSKVKELISLNKQLDSELKDIENNKDEEGED